MCIRHVVVPAGNGMGVPESAAYEAPYGFTRTEPS
jgi:hypothetical protein